MKNVRVRIEIRTRYDTNVIRYAGTVDRLIKTFVTGITGQSVRPDFDELVGAGIDYCDERLKHDGWPVDRSLGVMAVLAELNPYALLQILHEHVGRCRDPPGPSPSQSSGREPNAAYVGGVETKGLEIDHEYCDTENRAAESSGTTTATDGPGHLAEQHASTSPGEAA